MAVTSVTCAGTVSSSLAVSGSRSYVVKYIVQTNDSKDQAVAVCRANGIPTLTSYYQVGNDSDVAAFVSAYSPRLVSEDGSRRVWEVSVTFSTDRSTFPSDGGGSTGDIFTYESPWQEPVQISGSGIKFEQLARTRYTNPATGEVSPFCNSAGAYNDDEYVERSSFSLSMHVKYSYANWSLSITNSFVDTLNNATFFGMPAGYLKMMAPRWALLYTGESIPYWDVQYEFEGLYGGWNAIKKIDEGYWYIDVSDLSRVKRFADDAGLPVSGKGRLNGLGDKLDWWAAPVYYPSSGVDLYRTANYSLLGIPISVEQVVSGNFTRKQT